MQSFRSFLAESQDINLAMKAYKTLSYDARRAIDDWEHAMWADGRLNAAFKKNDEIAQEITDAFKPVREYLKKKHGKSIKLYRGSQKDDQRSVVPGRLLYSWTSDKKVAEHFAGLATSSFKTRLHEPIKQSEIEAALKRYEKTGFTTFFNKKYKRNKESPEYYDMYDMHNQLITDGDDLRREFEDIKKFIDEINQKKLDNAIMHEKKIPIDDIVWVTNNLNSKEFIVKNHR